MGVDQKSTTSRRTLTAVSKATTLQSPIFKIVFFLDSFSSAFNTIQGLPPSLYLSLLTAITLNLIAGLSRAATNFLLASLSAIVTASSAAVSKSNSDTAEVACPSAIGNYKWPFDIRTAIEEFELSPHLIYYACCPKCSALYKYEGEKVKNSPSVCTHVFLGETCATSLLKSSQNGKLVTPIHQFAYQSLSSWLARFLSRPGIVNILKTKVSKVPDMKSDIWHADAIRSLEGHDGNPFIECSTGELRLMFNLNIDWFNPYGNKNAGKHYSVGGIYLVCVNLPVELRYRIENVYLAGIIPGPSEPAADLSELDHFLSPLVDELLHLYYHGLMLAAVTGPLSTLLVRCAILALICDLPGFRKVAGFAGIKSRHMCPFCKLGKGKDDRRNFNIASWPRRTPEEYLAAAECWRECSSQKARNEEFKKNGIQWSELLRLPYWSPLRHGVVDSMHNLFLGNIQRHCRNIWGMDRSVLPNKKIALHDPDVQSLNLRLAMDYIKAGDAGKMQRLRLTYLAVIAHDNSVHVAAKNAVPTKLEYAVALVKWVKYNIRCIPVNLANQDVAPIEPQCTDCFA